MDAETKQKYTDKYRKVMESIIVSLIDGSSTSREIKIGGMQISASGWPVHYKGTVANISFSLNEDIKNKYKRYTDELGGGLPIIKDIFLPFAYEFVEHQRTGDLYVITDKKCDELSDWLKTIKLTNNATIVDGNITAWDCVIGVSLGISIHPDHHPISLNGGMTGTQ